MQNDCFLAIFQNNCNKLLHIPCQLEVYKVLKTANLLLLAIQYLKYSQFPADGHTVGLGTMAQHAQVWALPVAKLVGQSKIASNITLEKLIGLHHIQSSLLYNKNCGLQTSKHSFFRPYLKGLSRLVRWPKPQNSAVYQPIRIRFGVSMHLW